MAKQTAKAPKAPKANKPEVPEFIKHVVTQEDLDNNEELAASGVQVGDEIDIPNPEYVSLKQGVFKPELVATLQEHLHILNVWVNENGDWHFRDTPGFTSYSREEILNG